MRTVWKFRVMDRHGMQPGRVEMPSDAIVRHVGARDGELFLWAEVDPAAPTSIRGFVVHGTGHPVLLEATDYLGTAFDGPFVWHVYEVPTS